MGPDPSQLLHNSNTISEPAAVEANPGHITYSHAWCTSQQGSAAAGISIQQIPAQTQAHTHTFRGLVTAMEIHRPLWHSRERLLLYANVLFYTWKSSSVCHITPLMADFNADAQLSCFIAFLFTSLWPALSQKCDQHSSVHATHTHTYTKNTHTFKVKCVKICQSITADLWRNWRQRRWQTQQRLHHCPI